MDSDVTWEHGNHLHGPVRTTTSSQALNITHSMFVGLNNSERCIWMLWCAVMLLASLLGNITVLVSSVKYKAIMLDKITVIFIKCIAVVDLSTAVVFIGPAMSSIARQTWVYGETACKTTAFARHLFSAASLVLIAMCNVTKITSLVFPLRAQSCRNRTGYVISIFLWCFICSVVWCLLTSLLLEVASFTKNWNEWPVPHDPDLFYCKFYIGDTTIRTLYDAMLITITFVPVAITAITTVMLLCYLLFLPMVDKRSESSTQGVTTLIMLSVAFFFIFLPTGCELAVKQNASPESYVYYRRFSSSFLYLYYAIKPLIYFVTINSFNTFVRRMKLEVVHQYRYRRSNLSRKGAVLFRAKPIYTGDV